MIDKLKRLTSTKSFHLCMIIVIIAVILFIVGMLILRYNVEGETNMPFELTKITIVSSQEGADKTATDTRWAFDIYQTNDIYLYIDKNAQYEKQETIQSIKIAHFNIEAQNKENIKIYKPDAEDQNTIFRYKDENIVDSIEYVSDVKSDLKNMKISNQGGIVAFRCANNNIAEYKSNDEEIEHMQLLKKAGITNEQLKIKLNFDLRIITQSGKEYKANVELQLPEGNVVDEGTTSIEITDLNNIIFKREKN